MRCGVRENALLILAAVSMLLGSAVVAAGVAASAWTVARPLYALADAVTQLHEAVSEFEMPTPAPAASLPMPTPGPFFEVKERRELSSTAETESFTVRAEEIAFTEDWADVVLEVEQRGGPQDLLFYPPVLRDGEGKEYRADALSLEKARFALLKPEAEITLRFKPAPPEDADLTLVFNPGMGCENPVAPEVEMRLR